MDTELLLTFLTVARSGGISAAARVLHRSQPAVTERLQKLTQQVGEPLTMRSGRGYSPDAGRGGAALHRTADARCSVNAFLASPSTLT